MMASRVAGLTLMPPPLRTFETVETSTFSALAMSFRVAGRAGSLLLPSIIKPLRSDNGKVISRQVHSDMNVLSVHHPRPKTRLLRKKLQTTEAKRQPPPPLRARRFAPSDE